ncbi:MAG: hypothetical protein EOO46_10530 [Flavobacterium sp.]|nr:MAG: hypothetical protein EOO46_10530 [Flavobacterium sp.]
MPIYNIRNLQTILPIEQKIIAELDSLFELSFTNGWGGSTNWTSTIKEVLSNLGYLFDCTSSSHYDGGEWLFDLIWFTKNERGNFDRLVLAMESEWYMEWHHIKYDFDKLLTTNAIHKLMICQSTLSKKNELLNNFQTSINDYLLGPKEERFLISIYNSDDETEFWHYVITRD